MVVIQDTIESISERKDDRALDNKIKNVLGMPANDSVNIEAIKPQETIKIEARKEPTIKIKTRNVNTSTNNTSVITKVEFKNATSTINKDNLMKSITRESVTEDKIEKNSATSSHRLIGSTKETTFISKFKNCSVDDDNLQFADRLCNPWSGFTKKPLLNRRLNANSNNKVSLMKAESYVDRVSKQLHQNNDK